MDRSAHGPAFGHESVRFVAAAILSGQALIAAVLVWRYLVGALARDLSVPVAALVTTAAVVLAVAAYAAIRATCSAAVRDGRSPAILTGALVPPLVVALVLVPAHSIGAVAYVTVLFVFAGSVLWFIEERFSSPAEASVRRTDGAVRQGETDSDPQRIHPFRSTPDDASSLRQWLTRTQSVEGGETVEGGLKVSFARGQRQQVLHVSFCPPLPSIPEVECELLDEAPVEVRVAAAHPYGLRIEARREADSNDPLTSEIGFAATVAAAEATAA